LADSGSATPERVKPSIGNVSSRETGLTRPPELPFSFALERARELDQSALGMLYRHFMPVVYRYVLARVGTVHLAGERAAGRNDHLGHSNDYRGADDR
jgi:hypothetical protein